MPRAFVPWLWPRRSACRFGHYVGFGPSSVANRQAPIGNSRFGHDHSNGFNVKPSAPDSSPSLLPVCATLAAWTSARPWPSILGLDVVPFGAEIAVVVDLPIRVQDGVKRGDDCHCTPPRTY